MQKEKNTYVPTVEDRILATELELNVGLALSTENPDTIQELLHRYLDTYIEIHNTPGQAQGIDRLMQSDMLYWK